MMSEKAKWLAAKAPWFAVFDPRGIPWSVSLAKSRRHSQRVWLRDGGYRGAKATWRYWYRRGYRCLQVDWKIRVRP